MEKRFKTSVNGEFDYDFSRKEIESLDALALSDSEYHILQDKKSFTSKILTSDFYKRTYSVQINSNVYEVQILNELDQKIEAMGLSVNISNTVNDIKAPMPGLILEVNIEAGKEVAAGDYVLVLEAMKMENTITAPRDGIVKKVHVVKGETVEKSQLLIEME